MRNTLLILSFLGLHVAKGQNIERQWVYFKGKCANQPALSEKALQKRLDRGIIIDELDWPVCADYVQALKGLGYKVLMQSRWLNAVVVEATSWEAVESLSFVRNTSPVLSYRPMQRMEGGLSKKQDLGLPLKTNFAYGEAYEQIAQLNGVLLHDSGYAGAGMDIAVFDAGFFGVDNHPVFQKLRDENRILQTRDFVEGDSMVFEASYHGTQVLSTMGGWMPDSIVGTAPEANFYLFRTEDVSSETLVEEFYWMQAAEYADSIGVDVINSSLGYTTFDDTTTSHSYEDMDGNTTLVTRAADMAAAKGILVVNSAGNSGSGSWYYIGAPADGDSVMAIGAVSIIGEVAGFSSRGPSSDGDVKPNVMARGQAAVVVGYGESAYTYANGTSFSSPIMAGMSACLWQKHPEFSNMEIKDAIERSAHLYLSPNDDYGYGIPDFVKASEILSLSINETEQISLSLYPNPVRNRFFITLRREARNIHTSLYDMTGRLVYEWPPSMGSYSMSYVLPAHIPEGVYQLVLKSEGKVQSLKLVH